MKEICRYRRSALIGLTALVATTLNACGGSSGSNSFGQEQDGQDFASRILLSGDSPGAWKYYWGCEVRTLGGTYSGVPLRFYRDGQLHVGIGTSETLGTWKRDNNQSPRTFATVVLTLDRAAPQFFGTDSEKLLIDLWFQGDGYVESNGYLRDVNDLPEDTVEIDLVCIRYNKAGDVVGGDLPPWLQSYEETPTFITTGEATGQFTPRDEEEPATIPAQDQPTSEPVSSPSTETAPPATQPSENAPLAEIIAQVKDIWYTGDLVDTVDGVRQRFSSVIQFKNGDVSNDGETISNEGIAASKRKNPEKWGEGRVSSSGLLSYKWRNSRSWLEPYFSAPTRSYPRNQKINGCFENGTGVKGPGSSPRIKRLCLSADGSFKVDDTANSTGNYLIDGHAIRLIFSDGQRAEFLFGAYYKEGFIYRVIVASRVFHATR